MEPKYKGIEDLRAHWVSFGRHPNPVTLDSLRRTEVATAAEFELFPEQPKAKTRFVLLEDEEFCSLPDPDWLIQGILPERGTGAFWGLPNTGKTFLAIDVALCVALGRSWRGLPVKKPGPVLYIAAEDDYGIRMRYKAAKAFYNVRNAPVTFLAARPRFASTEHQKELLATIAAKGEYRLIIVDTLAKVSSGVDENAVKDTSVVIDFCRSLGEAVNGLVILLHHSNKNGEMRGSSALHGDFDVEWCVTFAGEDDTWNANREMRISKMRNAPSGEKYPWRLAQVPGTESCVVDWGLLPIAAVK